MNRRLVALLLLAPLTAGCLAAEAPAEPVPPTTVPAHADLAWTVVEWEGYARVGAADRFAHIRETEVVVAPLARMGFDLDVPEGARGLVLRLSWPPGTQMHLMTHGPHGAGMPTYMGGMPDGGEECLRIPADDVLPGIWKVMAHTETGATDLRFTIVAEVLAPSEPRVLDGWHGHSLTDDMEMEHREHEPCDA